MDVLDKTLNKKETEDGKEAVVEDVKDIEPDESMRGFLMKSSNKVGGGDDENILKMFGEGLKFGAMFLKDTVGKAVAINNLEK